MKIAYIECFAGISGDMLLGALVDAGVSSTNLEQATEALGIGASLRFTQVNRSGIQSTKVDVLVDGEPAENVSPTLADHAHTDHAHADPAAHAHSHSHEDAHTHLHIEPQAAAHAHEHSHSHTHGRHLSEILALIDHAGISDAAARLAKDAFRLLAAAESKIHGVPEEKIHFHEVGAVDAIVDIVCNAVGLTEIGADRWVCSPLNVGGGSVECAHGRFPVPAPATAELLKGVPTYSSGIAMELVTPTGAALLRALNCAFGERPQMMSSAIGYGAGNRNPERFPNVVRINIGEAIAEAKMPRQAVSVLECAIDDQSPQVLAHFLQLALEQGALDVMSAAVTMKKGRLGTLVTLLVPLEREEEFGKLILKETTTLGYRVRRDERVCLDRGWTEVETIYGRVRIKTGSFDGVEYNFAPEYEDCKLLAEEHGVPVKLVMQAALGAATLERASVETKATR
jgi:pyridinium-3,5-bisthiocarboxylic acid mononucleotide nickel chelatase